MSWCPGVVVVSPSSIVCTALDSFTRNDDLNAKKLGWAGRSFVLVIFFNDSFRAFRNSKSVALHHQSCALAVVRGRRNDEVQGEEIQRDHQHSSGCLLRIKNLIG